MRQPKTLECFHTFCAGCVAQLDKIMHTEKEGVKCPVCRAFTEHKQMKTNVLITEMLEAHQGITKQDICLSIAICERVLSG